MYLLWFAEAGQLHGNSSQVGSVGEGQKSRTGSFGKHVLLILRSLITQHLRTQEEEEEEERRGKWIRHEKTPVCLPCIISDLENEVYFQNIVAVMESEELTKDLLSVVNTNMLKSKEHKFQSGCIKNLLCSEDILTEFFFSLCLLIKSTMTLLKNVQHFIV